MSDAASIGTEFRPADRRHFLRSWSGRGAWALFDQLLFGGAGFLVNILLARWLPAEQYGAFALAFLLFLLFGAAHTAVLTEPMLVFGAGKHRNELSRYLSVLLAAHALLTLAAGGLLGLVALILSLAGAKGVGFALGGLAAALPFLLLLWLLRRRFYLSLQPQRAALGDGVFLVGSLLGVVTAHRSGHLSPTVAFVVMGGVALLASLILLLPLKLDVHALRGFSFAREVVADHRRFGAWSLLGQVVFWSSGQILILLIPLVLGLQAVAAFAAVQNVFRPLYPLLQSAGALLLPALSSVAAAPGGFERTRPALRRGVLLWGGGFLAYGLVVSVVASPLLHHLYGGRYDAFASLVPFLAVATAATAVIQILTIALKAAGQVRSVPLVWGFSAVMTGTLSVPVMLIAGLHGALGIFAASYVLGAVAAWRKTR